MRRRLAEWAARKAAWRAAKIVLTRLGVPFWAWPVLWAGRKIIRHYRKREPLC